MLGWIARRELSRSPSQFLTGPDFSSIWELAFRWSDSEPTTGDAEIPEQVRQATYRLVRGFFKGDLNLRRSNGHKVMREPVFLLVWDANPWRNVLWRCLSKAEFDEAYLTKLYVERSEVLAWCEKEKLSPPRCWAPLISDTVISPSDEDEDDKDGWYERLTEQRRRKVACLELARHLWKQDHQLSYEAVRTHTLMKQAGLYNVFTADAFKKWSRDFAPDEAKQGGRRSQASTSRENSNYCENFSQVSKIF